MWKTDKKDQPYPLSFEQWLMLHNIEINQMLAATSPQTPVRTAIKRIVIVDDQTITQRASRFGNTGRGSNRNSYFFPGPENDCYTQVDSISPWSLDVQGRWFLETLFSSFFPSFLGSFARSNNCYFIIH